MQQQSSDEALELFQELAKRIYDHPHLSKEWQEASAEFPLSTKRTSVGARHRLLEWFLLERTSQALGVPPVAAWAPQSVEYGSGWGRLLDTLLGIFRRGPQVQEGPLTLEDMWSGRSILVDAWGEADWIHSDTLVVGRFLELSPGRYLPFAGVFTVKTPGLIEAVSRDLDRIRKADSRKRISQLECEYLFASLDPHSKPDSGSEENPHQRLQTLEAEIRNLLKGSGTWSLERLRTELQSTPVQDILNQLAFETQVDLEAMRRSLPDYLQALLASQSPGSLPTTPSSSNVYHSTMEEDGTKHNAIDVEAALNRFDTGRAAGKPLNILFEKLEKELGLEAGASETPEYADQETSQEVMGPDQLPSFALMLETFVWERSASQQPLEEREHQVIRSFVNFLDQQHPKGLDVRQLSAELVTAFFLKSDSQTQLAQFRHGLAAFLAWLEHEQEAPLNAFADRLLGDLGQRLEQIVVLNAQLARESRVADAVAQTIAIDPVRVPAENNEQALVVDIPEEHLSLIRPGDRLLGHWRNGQFALAGLLPSEALPESPPAN